MLKVGDIVKVNKELADNLRKGWGRNPRILKYFLSRLKIERLTLQDAEFVYPKWFGGGTFYLPQASLRKVRKTKRKVK